MKCPGQDTRYWKPGDIFEVPCPVCEAKIEFFKDEGLRTCPKCGYKLKNPRLDLSCLEWCAYANQCLSALPEIFSPDDQEQKLLVNKLIKAMKQVFREDKKRIAHTLLVLEQAREILRKEGGDPRVVLGSAVLHDIGIKTAEEKYGSNAGRYQELEGPPIARKILEELSLEPELIEHICKIIANHHSAQEIDTLEFKIVWDADWLVNLPEEYPNLSKDKLKELIDKVFKTKTGKEMAYQLYL